MNSATFSFPTRFPQLLVWLSAVLGLLTGHMAHAQAPAWQTALTIGGGNDIYATATATGASGDVFVAGAFLGTANFGSFSLTSAGSTDAFVAKWSAASNTFVWARRAGGTGADRAMALTVNGVSIYVAGYFRSATADFGSSTLTSAGGADIFVTKLADAGGTAAFAWAQRAGGAYDDGSFNAVTQGGSLALASTGTALYLAGSFGSPTADFGSTTLTNAASQGRLNDVFVARLTDAGSTGTFAWAYRAGGPDDEYAAALAVSGSSIYVVGSFQSATVAFGALALANADASARTYDAFVTKLTDTGSTATFAWAQRAGGNGSDFARAVAVSGPSVYVTGRFSSSPAAFGSVVLTNAAAGAVSHDAFVAMLLDNGSAGSFAWAQRAGGADDEYFYAVAVSGTSVYVAGGFSSASVDFGGTTLTNTAYGGVNDVCVARLTDGGTSGSFDWAQQAGGTGDDGAASIALNGSRVYVGGAFQNAARFGGITLTGTATPGNPSAFLAALVDGPLPTLSSSTPGSGAIGSTLTLTGTNLTGTTRISFAGRGGPAAPNGFVVNAAGTQITGIVVPAGATTGSISVTTPVGQSNGGALRGHQPRSVHRRVLAVCYPSRPQCSIECPHPDHRHRCRGQCVRSR